MLNASPGLSVGLGASRGGGGTHPSWESGEADDLRVIASPEAHLAGSCRADSRLEWGLLSRRIQGVYYWSVKERYLCEIRLEDLEGSVIPKTRLGRRIGSRFAEVTEWSPDVVAPLIHAAYTNLWGGGGTQLPAPAELFEIPRTGYYNLFLRFQVFYCLPPGEQSKTHRRVRFPEMRIPVVCEQAPNRGGGLATVFGVAVVVGAVLIMILRRGMVGNREPPT